MKKGRYRMGMFLDGQLKVSAELAQAHKAEIMRVHGGYCVANLDTERPGTHVELSINRGGDGVVLRSVRNEVDMRIVQLANNEFGKAAMAFLLENGAVWAEPAQTKS